MSSSNDKEPAAAARSRWGFVLTAALVLMVALLLAAVIGGAVVWRWNAELPALDKVTDYQPRQPLQVFTADKVEIAQFGSERRQALPLALIPKRMQDAVIAVEDARFREHHGIDPIGVARAVWANLSGGMRQGASTITQQVARTFLLSSRRSLERKVKEALLALKIERELSKDDILERYMNQIYLGQRAYGFAAAAQAYFGKTLDELSIAEAAMLAGLPQNPVYANPVANAERARARQLLVLSRMRATGVISDAELAAARDETLKLRSPSQVTLHAEYVAEIARRMVFDRFGESAYSQGYKVYTAIQSADQLAAWESVRKGVIGYDRRQPWRGPEGIEDLPPTAAADIERAAAQALKDYRDDEDLRLAIVTDAAPTFIEARLASGQSVRLEGAAIRPAQLGLKRDASEALSIRRGAVLRLAQQEMPGAKGQAPTTGWVVSQWPQVQAAFVAMTPGNGRVRALVGGFDFAREPFNRVTQAWRQPGSSFKPFLYSAALEHGVMPATVINDAPLAMGDPDLPAGWDPQNFDGQYDGPLSLRRALAKSKNLVSIRLLREIGVPAARDWAGRFGFEPDKLPDNLTLALGTGSTTPLQMAQAYSVFANGGFRVAPVVVERITDAYGVTLYEAPPAPARNEVDRVLPARNVFMMRSLLQEVTRNGTAARAQATLKRPDLFGKTGTTNDAVDAWFAGFQPSLTAVAWMGYDEPKSLGARETGGGVALPIWIDFMQRTLKGVPVAKADPPPEGVVKAGDDWTYNEWIDGGSVMTIGVEEAAVPLGTMPVVGVPLEEAASAAGASAPR
jgi:penicillin-binding protein 1A